MKRIALIFLSVFSIGFGVLALSAPVTVAADAKDEVCQGVNASNGGGCTDSSASIQKIIKAVVNIFSFMIGILAVIMIMVGGFKYVTAAGESSNVTSAKHTIIYAIVGLVIAALSQVIVRFVLNSVK